MKVVRRALTAVVISGTALAGVATVGATAAQAAHKLPTSLSIKAPHAVTYNTTATVTGKLRLAGHKRTALGSELVTLMARSTKRHAKWAADGSGTTDATTGVVTITTTNPLTAKEQVRLVFAGDASHKGSKSAIRTIKVAYAVTASEVGTLSTGATITGTVDPATNGAAVLLQVQMGKHWRTVGHAKEAKDNSGSFTFALTKKDKAGSYRVVKEAGHGLLAGRSATIAVS